MTGWDVELEFAEGTSTKFWRARLAGKTLEINYGRVGTVGQLQPKDFPSAEAARRELDKLVAERRRKGYIAAGAASVDDDEVDDDREPDDEDEGDEVGIVSPSARPVSVRMVLATGVRRIETVLYLDGNTLRMESTQTFESADAAKHAHDRLTEKLAAEGYKRS